MARRDFSGKVILITGAAGGLGAALCHRFAAAGARIAAMDLDATRLQDLVATLPAGTLSIAGNIDDPAACQAAIDQTVAHFGALDGLINNAGISHRSLFLDSPPAVMRAEVAEPPWPPSAARPMPVAMNDGQIKVTPTPRSSTSERRVSKKPSSACLLAQYPARPNSGA